MAECPLCGTPICEKCHEPVDGEDHFDFEGRDYHSPCAEELGLWEAWWWQVWKEGGWIYDG